MIKGFLAAAFILSFINTAYAEQTQVKACVLYYERAEHPFLDKIQKIFKGHSEIVLIKEAKPTDIAKCIADHNPEEVLIFAHSFEIDSETTKLGFFIKKTEEETLNQYKETLKKTNNRWKQITQKKGFVPCRNNPRDKIFCNEEQEEEIKLRMTLYRLERLKQSDPVYKMIFGYDKGLFFQKPFEDLHNLVKTNQVNLKKIRLMSCEPHKIFNAYPALKMTVKDLGVELDIAPKSKILSYFHDKHITTIDSDWLSKSLRSRKE